MAGLTEYGDVAGDVVDEWGRRRINGLLEDGTRMLVAAGASFVIITDSLMLSDVVLRGKALVLSDSVGVSDSSCGDKSLKASDALTLADHIFTPARVLRVLEDVGLADNVAALKILKVADAVALLEVVASGVAGAKKAHLFLLIGDLAVQLTSE